jgi:Trm5-related predicted tRNA methylase
MHSKSAKDICLNTDGTLCVILLTKAKPEKDVVSIYEALNTKYDRKIDRGAKFKFMWLNVEIEKKWGDVFKYEGSDKVVVLNPGKRKRYTNHDGELTKDSIAMTLESISGGDARFNRVS